MTPSVAVQGRAGYDLTELVAPKMAGAVYRAFITALESWPLGVPLVNHIKKDSELRCRPRARLRGQQTQKRRARLGCRRFLPRCPRAKPPKCLPVAALTVLRPRSSPRACSPRRGARRSGALCALRSAAGSPRVAGGRPCAGSARRPDR
jgi:hypothetical protein